MRIVLSKRILTIILVVAILFLAVDTFLIFDLRRALEGAAQDSAYDFVVFQDGDLYKAKNQASGMVAFTSDDASLVLNGALDEGNTVHIKTGDYLLRSDVLMYNKENAKIVSDGARFMANSGKLIIKGDNYTLSRNNRIEGLTVINGTLRIENSFGISLSNMLFEDCSTALELVNSETWSEGTKIEDSRFINCTTSIVFRTPIGTAKGSYASTEVHRCFFNLIDNSVGIVVERGAEFSDSQLGNIRMWMGENGFTSNQTGILVDGSMHQTLLKSVVFESFADYPNELYALSLGETSVTPPILAGGVSFLGNWTARIRNPFGRWIGNGVFRQDMSVPIGLAGQYGATSEFHLRPLTILDFKPKIQVDGSFTENQIITVRLRVEFVDNVISRSVEKSFTNSTAVWLNDDDLLQLLPSQGVIWAILVDAKASSASTDASVQISFYGATT